MRSLSTALAPHFSTLLSAAAAVSGIAGTALLAIDPTHVLPVFALYLASSCAWIGVGVLTKQPWLLCSNVIYFALSLKALVL
jgi:hypothetical protein